MEKLKAKGQKIKSYVDFLGNACIGVFHYLGLFLIGGVVIWASLIELKHVFNIGEPGVENVLMLFIYLELGAMVGIYFKTNHLPVRFLIYVGITAMIRHLIGLITDHGDNHTLIIFYCIGIFVLSLSIFMVRYSSYKFPSEKIIEEKPEENKIIEKRIDNDDKLV